MGVGEFTYVVSFPRVLRTVKCPGIGCQEVAHSAGRLRDNFIFQNKILQIAVVQEGKYTLPRCGLCVIHMSVGRIIKHHKM